MMKIYFQIADEDTDGGFLLLTPKGAGSVNGSGESCFNSFIFHIIYKLLYVYEYILADVCLCGVGPYRRVSKIYEGQQKEQGLQMEVVSSASTLSYSILFINSYMYMNIFWLMYVCVVQVHIGGLVKYMRVSKRSRVCKWKW